MHEDILEVLFSINLSLSHKYTMLESTNNQMIICRKDTGKKFKITIEDMENAKD